ncbi:hypothetical protein SK578_0400 [Streptococcus mitis]|uniref:Uncharacterized protein n=1 Tax=Streptococcus mitis TaxID=28037 RepID=A0A081QVR2_STRMT|nr:hypothetical protein SK578_0400 [Streptococcus mitis]
MNPIKAFAKIYGNYFLTMQGVKVMKTKRKMTMPLSVWENSLLQIS